MRVLRLLPLLAAAAGCRKDVEPSPHEALTDAHIRAMEQITSILDGIHDRASAELARPQMETIGKRIREINEEEDKLPPPGPAEQARLDAKLRAAAESLEPRMQQAMDRVKGDPDAVLLVSNMLIEATALDSDR